jgi:acetyl-CoA acyltransferase
MVPPACILASASAGAGVGADRKDAPGLVSPSWASSPRSWASARCRPPRRRCAKAGLTIEDIGLFELNEAFAVQVLAFLDHFGIADDDPRVNEYGGAIALGHPLASSGVRLMTQLAAQFAEHPEVRYGLTAMCIGIGMGGSPSSGRTRITPTTSRRPARSPEP